MLILDVRSKDVTDLASCSEVRPVVDVGLSAPVPIAVAEKRVRPSASVVTLIVVLASST